MEWNRIESTPARPGSLRSEMKQPLLRCNKGEREIASCEPHIRDTARLGSYTGEPFARLTVNEPLSLKTNSRAKACTTSRLTSNLRQTAGQRSEERRVGK